MLVQDMDHFCPWSGTTIARANMVYFYLFIAAVMGEILFSAVVLLLGFLSSVTAPTNVTHA